MGSTSPFCLPLCAPPFKASKSRPATTPKLLDSSIVRSTHKFKGWQHYTPLHAATLKRTNQLASTEPKKKKILHTRYSPKMAVVIHVTFQQQLMHVNGSTKDSNMEWKSWSCWTAAHRHLHTTAPAAPARDSGPHPHFTTRQALLGQKSSIGCSIP
jgi:hypothetical protein